MSRRVTKKKTSKTRPSTNGGALKPREERFCLFYVRHGNASEAYREAHPRSRSWTDKTVHTKASAMLGRDEVRGRIAALQEAAAKRNEVTVDSLIDELEEARSLALTDPRAAGAAVQASMGKGKLMGLVVDKAKVDAKIDGRLAVAQLPPLTPEAARAIMERIEAERF